MFSKKIALAVSVLSLSLSAFAEVQPVSASLLLQGEIRPVLNIEVEPEEISDALPLHERQTNTKVATVIEQSNLVGGYKVKVSSLNGGNLKRNGGTELFNYQLTYNEQGVNLATSSTFEYEDAGVTNVRRDVAISYTAADESGMIAGIYSDTVTFEISPN